MRGTLIVIVCILAVGGCAGQRDRPGDQASNEPAENSVLDIARIVQQGWRYFPVKGHTNYRIVNMDSRLAIRATGAGGAGGLIRRVGGAMADCGFIDWTWRVDTIQASANLSSKSTDDVAAAIFVLFGDPGFLSGPNKAPTLRYVWTAGAHRKNDIIANPYMPGSVKNIVVRAGTAGTGQWHSEKRDLTGDFRRAFGHAPEDAIGAVAIFTDNDQTREPVLAYYRDINLACPNG